MRSDDFWNTVHNSWGINTTLNTALLDSITRGPVAEFSDIEIAVALARLAHEEFQEFGTSAHQAATEPGSRSILTALRAVTRRLGIPFDPPFTDFTRFRTYWIGQGAAGAGGWQARREILDRIFEPLHSALALREAGSIQSTLAEPISPHRVTGWPRVDEEIAELRRHFEIATSPQDYRNIGNDCVTVLEAISAVAYDHAIHGREGQPEPPVASTKERLDRFVEVSIVGAENAPIRKVARAVIELAQAVKHRPAGNRRDAGIAADAAIQLANLLRRAQETPASAPPLNR
ncbi:hypothetical protein HD599_003334 [Conyzicola lurida]|uniref:Uncharacterized protein n=1 Tax=Conyzicola lurida TaxID=1172621 RepID=A0A841AT87_9MICO|nr:hypothetical protein [Conyzicola lurida]MBB5845011.1 hypothetical protein [Conyzicola lurida]